MTSEFYLDEVASVFNGKTPSTSQQRKSGHPVLKIKDVDEAGDFHGFDSFVDLGLAKSFKDKFLQVGDSLVLNAAHNADYVGSKLYKATAEVVNALPTGEWLVVRSTHGDLDPEFLNYWLQSSGIRRQLRGLVRGIHLYPTDVSSLKISLPAQASQKKIVERLNRANRLRRLCIKARQQAEGLLSSAFLEMFARGQHYDSITVDEVASAMRTGPFGSQLLHSEFVDAGIAVLGIDNAVKNRFTWQERRFITEEKYQKLKRYTVRPGDVIITIMGTCGRCAIVPDWIGTAINTKHLCCITIDQSLMLPEFLHSAFLNHPDVLQSLGVSQRGAIMDGLNMGIIKELKVPYPSMRLQRDFQRICRTAAPAIDKYREAESQAEGLFSSMLRDFFEMDRHGDEVELALV